MLARTRGGRLWQGPLSVGLLSSLIAAAAAEDQRAPSVAPAGIEAKVTDGRLTLRADGAPLAEVLRAIGEAGAFEVALRGGLAADGRPIRP